MPANEWQRLADVLKPHTMVGAPEKIAAVMAVRNACLVLAEDAERDGPTPDYFRHDLSSDARSRAVDYNDPAGAVGEHRSFQQTSPECARASESSESRRAGWESASRNAATPDEGAGSSAPAAGSLPPLDPALVEECLQLFYKHGGGVSSHAGGVSMDAALNHYRERVEGPLRELAEQRREALEYERGETRRAADASAFYQREADRLRGELAAARNLIAVGEKQRDELRDANDKLAKERDAHSNARQAWQAKAEGDFAPQPTDEERRRLIENLRDPLLPISSQACERIATLLEEPQSPQPRKSIGRRWVVRFADGDYSTRAYPCQGDAATASRAAHGTVVLCDLVPVAEEEKP